MNRTDNAVEFEIPATALPSDHKVSFSADKGGASLSRKGVMRPSAG
jgi:hypothetical protein